MVPRLDAVLVGMEPTQGDFLTAKGLAMLDITDWLMDRPLSVYGTLIAGYLCLAWAMLRDLEID